MLHRFLEITRQPAEVIGAPARAGTAGISDEPHTTGGGALFLTALSFGVWALFEHGSAALEGT